jgi:hypothetical protein
MVVAADVVIQSLGGGTDNNDRTSSIEKSSSDEKPLIRAHPFLKEVKYYSFLCFIMSVFSLSQVV